MSQVYRSHPTDWHSTAGAAHTNGKALTEAFEATLTEIRDRYGIPGVAGALEALCSLAIARVELLERAPARRQRRIRPRPRPRVDPVIRDERAAVATLHPVSGNVIKLPLGRRSA